MTAILDNGEWKVPIKIDSSTIVYRKALPHEVPAGDVATEAQEGPDYDQAQAPEPTEAPKRRGRPPKAKE